MFSLKIDQEISLRTFHPDDADPLFELTERNRARLRAWIHPSLLFETAKATRIFTIECFFDGLEDSPETLDLFHHYASELNGYFLSPRRSLEMGIWFQGSLVGFINLSRLHDSFTALEFGYWITAEQEGKGIITRCVSALMDYAVNEMKVQRFVIGCAVNNQRSRAVPERLGYRLHAIVPNGEKVGDLIYDRAVYGIRSSAWCERNAGPASTC
ncbi:MAG: GNAT family protein [Anaerolineales bacterium]|jgi:ribosomal-protein-serine acetyltransferase|nr:GNAT family protein [Anaerolineales bacterium]